jgi:AcrR family transcriptional regulator
MRGIPRLGRGSTMMRDDGEMPKIVDHAARRAQIVDAVLTIAARDGHPEVTSRAVTRELDLAVGTLWHYFSNFDEVLQAAAIEVTRRTLKRIDEASAGLRGLARIEATMSQVLPVDPLTRSEALVVVGFWGRLALKEGGLESASAVSWRDRFVEAIEEAVADGELVEETPRDVVADVLRSISYGQQVAHLLERQSADEHRRILHGCLDPWRADRHLPN